MKVYILYAGAGDRATTKFTGKVFKSVEIAKQAATDYIFDVYGPAQTRDHFKLDFKDLAFGLGGYIDGEYFFLIEECELVE